MLLHWNPQTLAITQHTALKANLKKSPKPMSRSNYVRKNHESQNFPSWSWNEEPGLFHVKHLSSENIRRYAELFTWSSFTYGNPHMPSSIVLSTSGTKTDVCNLCVHVNTTQYSTYLTLPSKPTMGGRGYWSGRISCSEMWGRSVNRMDT